MPDETNPAAPKRRTRARPADDAESARERVLVAAERRFAERGVAATALREIAADSGVAINLISYHFRTKDELLEAVLERHATRITAIRQDQLSELELRHSPHVPPVREIVAALIGPVFRLKEEDPALWSSFLGLLARERGSPAWAATIGRRVSAMLRQHAVLLHRAVPSANRHALVGAVTVAFLSVLLSSPVEVRSLIGPELTADWDEAGLEALLVDLMTAAALSLAR